MRCRSLIWLFISICFLSSYSYAKEFKIVPQERSNPASAKIVNFENNAILVEHQIGESGFKVWNLSKSLEVDLLRKIDLGYKSDDYLILKNTPLLVTSNGYTLDFWDLRTGILIKRSNTALPGNRIRFIEHFPQEELVATVHADGSLVKWKVVPFRDFTAVEISLEDRFDTGNELFIDTIATEKYLYGMSRTNIQVFDVVKNVQISSYSIQSNFQDPKFAISELEDHFFILGQPYFSNYQVLEYGTVEEGGLSNTNSKVIGSSISPIESYQNRNSASDLLLSSDTKNLIILSYGTIYEFSRDKEEVVRSYPFCSNTLAHGDFFLPKIVGLGSKGFCFKEGLENNLGPRADLFVSLVSQKKEFLIHTPNGALRRFSGLNGQQQTSVMLDDWMPFLTYSPNYSTIGAARLDTVDGKVILKFASFDATSLLPISNAEFEISVHRHVSLFDFPNRSFALSDDGKSFALQLSKLELFISNNGVQELFQFNVTQSIEDIVYDARSQNFFSILVESTGFGVSNELVEFTNVSETIDALSYKQTTFGEFVKFVHGEKETPLKILTSERVWAGASGWTNQLSTHIVDVVNKVAREEEVILESPELINILSVTGSIAFIEIIEGRKFIELGTKEFVDVNNNVCPPLFQGTYLWAENSTKIVCASNSSVSIHEPTGEKLATTITYEEKGWATITPSGFFVSSNISDLDGDIGIPITVAAGFESFSIGQAFQSFYDPSAVELILSDSDAQNIKSRLLSGVDLAKILQDGAPPVFDFIDSSVDGLFADIELEIRDIGGDVGNARLKLNGRVLERPVSLGGSSKFTLKNIPLGSEKNIVEVSISNGAGSIWAKSKTIQIDLLEGTELDGSRLYIFTIGINSYSEPSYELEYALNDQDLILETFENAKLKETGYSKVIPIRLSGDLDQVVTKTLIGNTFQEIANLVGDDAMRPHDVFILHVSGHGYSVDRNYYFLPQDFKVNDNGVSDSVLEQGISQEQWTLWLDGINAQKSLLIFDTCQSGELSKILGRSQNAFDKFSRNLTLTSGRTLISASGPQDIAIEGYRGHGVLSYSFVESLGEINQSPDGISTRHIQNHIEFRVPEITSNLTRFDSRYSTNGPYAQKPHIVRNGFDFVVTAKPIGKVPLPENLPPQGVFISDMDLKVFDSPGGQAVRTLEKYTGVRVVALEENWAEVSRYGKVIGFIKFSDLVKVN